LLLLCLILAGCGGGGSPKWQEVRGDGFRFNAPADWTVSGATASSGAVDRVEVVVFRLLRPYDPARRLAVGRELDGVASRIVQQLKGSIVQRSWVAVGSHDARAYAIDYGAKTAEITFVLRGRSEYQLLCRRPKSGDDTACRELTASFRLG
jgi:hypothetical protein